MQTETVPEPRELRTWHGGGSTCRTWGHGEFELKGWSFVGGNREAGVTLHVVDVPGADVTARPVTDFVILDVSVPGDVVTRAQVYLSPAQAVTLALQLAKAGTDVAVDKVLAEAGIRSCPAGHPADVLGNCTGPCAGEEWDRPA